MASSNSAAVLDAVYPALPPRVAEIRRDVTNVATGFGADETALLQINLAVSEAATNAIMHAYRDRAAAGDVRVLVQHDDGHIDVSICDSGIGMSPRPDSPGMGLGLCLMAHEAVRFEVKTPAGGGTEIFLRFPLRTC
jgi:serine/threonine-protein kinase RsbW/stage II sporulation protein AB (anti-sigma F factor)